MNGTFFFIEVKGLRIDVRFFNGPNTAYRQEADRMLIEVSYRGLNSSKNCDPLIEYDLIHSNTLLLARDLIIKSQEREKKEREDYERILKRTLRDVIGSLERERLL